MGCLFSLKLVCAEESKAREAKTAVFARIAELNAIMSDYSPESELNRLCATAGKGASIRVSEPLFDILERSARFSQASHGAFDVTLGPCTKLWRESRRNVRLPDPEVLREALVRVGWEKVKLDRKAWTVQLASAGMQIDLGGIAKGYAADEAVRLLRDRFGLKSFLIDAGGQVAGFGSPPGKAAWTVAIESPDDTPATKVALNGWHLATSGDAHQHVELGGRRYSHILDPKTGLGLTTLIQASVIASDGTTADAVTKVLCVSGGAEGMKLLAKWPGIEARVVLQGPGGLQSLQSPGWQKFALVP